MYEGSEFKYDDRQKELTGIKSWSMKGQKEIKKTLSGLDKQKQSYEEAIKQTKEILEMPELTKELEELKDKLTILQKLKIKEDKGDELKDQLKQQEEGLKEVNSDINKIKKVVGTRLKL